MKYFRDFILLQLIILSQVLKMCITESFKDTIIFRLSIFHTVHNDVITKFTLNDFSFNIYSFYIIA